MKKREYLFNLAISVEAESEEEARQLFWQRIDDSDYPLEPVLEEINEIENWDDEE